MNYSPKNVITRRSPEMEKNRAPAFWTSFSIIAAVFKSYVSNYLFRSSHNIDIECFVKSRMTVSAIYILGPSGKVIISRDYRGDVPESAVERYVFVEIDHSE